MGLPQEPRTRTVPCGVACIRQDVSCFHLYVVAEITWPEYKPNASIAVELFRHVRCTAAPSNGKRSTVPPRDTLSNWAPLPFGSTPYGSSARKG